MKALTLLNRVAIFALACFISLSLWADYPSVPKPFRYVSDYTNTLSPNEWQTLENALQDYSQKTSSQIAVVMIASTDGQAISDYAFNLGERWGIGRKAQNNGVLLLIAKNDKKLFIATGRGLEGALPDAVASSIIRNNITPYFAQNQYAQGIASGLSAIIAATQGEYAAQPQATTADADEDGFEGFEIFLILAVIIFFIFAPRSKNTYISPSSVDQVLRSTLRTSRSGGFGGGFGGSRSGGSNNNGGGFGGGSFGGGGAGGSW